MLTYDCTITHLRYSVTIIGELRLISD